jgi:hypothetical protein
MCLSTPHFVVNSKKGKFKTKGYEEIYPKIE